VHCIASCALREQGPVNLLMPLCCCSISSSSFSQKKKISSSSLSQKKKNRVQFLHVCTAEKRHPPASRCDGLHCGLGLLGTKFSGGVHQPAARGDPIWIHDAWTPAALSEASLLVPSHGKFLRDRRAARLCSATRTRLGSARLPIRHDDAARN
jgi:hypothetical protein